MIGGLITFLLRVYSIWQRHELLLLLSARNTIQLHLFDLPLNSSPFIYVWQVFHRRHFHVSLHVPLNVVDKKRIPKLKTLRASHSLTIESSAIDDQSKKKKLNQKRKHENSPWIPYPCQTLRVKINMEKTHLASSSVKYFNRRVKNHPTRWLFFVRIDRG